MSLPIEQVLEGKYEILDKIGEGGIGAVYKVRHRLLEEIRVIKVLRPQVAAKEEHRERFLYEAQTAIRLKHPNIAQLLDFSIAEDGTAFIVMEFIDGIGLDSLLKASGPPSLDLTMEIARQSLTALSFLHSSQLIHRDVSPDNLMLTTGFDGAPRVKLIDLGIAKNLEEDSNLTQTGVFLGKVRYCAPEQFSAAEDPAQELDQRCDIYSFGLLLYELLTGAYPFSGKTFAELAGCHLFQPPMAFEQTDPEGRVPPELRAVVLRSLEKDPARRFASADAFLAALEPFGAADESLEDELSRTVERTTAAIPALRRLHRPGSTQDHLNRHFGLDKTVAPEERAAPLPKTRVAPAVPPPVAAPVAAPAAPAAGRRFPLPSWGWWAAGAAAAVLAVVAAWRVAATAGPEPEAGAAAAIEVEATEPWSPVRGDPDVVPARIAQAPPAFEDETQPAAAATSPPAAPVEPPAEEGSGEAVADAAAEAAEPPAGADADGGAGDGPTGEPVERSRDLYTPGPGVNPPVLVRRARPVYDGKLSKGDAEVLVQVLVDEQGSVLAARTVKSFTFKGKLREAAVDAAKRSEFRPATRDGIAGRMWAEMRVRFEEG